MSKESDFVDLLNKEIYELKIADLEAKLAEKGEAVMKQLVYCIIHFLSYVVGVLFIGLGTDDIKLGVYQEWYFVAGCLTMALPFVYIWIMFWIRCLKNSCRRKEK